MKKLLSIVDVLGASYDVFESNESEDETLKEADGYCDYTIHRCVVDDFGGSGTDFVEDTNLYRQRVIRHELIHAFLYESGLGAESWASNEEIVDWIAHQFPKMLAAFRQAGAIEDEG